LAHGIGLACGRPLDVLDIDDRTACPLDVDALLQSTLASRTPRGGIHLFYRHAGLRSRAFRWGEFRSIGLAVVLPPAPGRSWLNQLVPAEIPPELAELIRRPVPRDYPTDITPAPLLSNVQVRADWLPRELYYKLLRLVPISDRVTHHHQRRVSGILNIALRKQKRRNEALYIAGLCLRELIHDGIVSMIAAEQLLFDVAVLNGYIAKDGVEAARATIRSGLGASSGAREISKVK
jgi:hypothetical protein